MLFCTRLGNNLRPPFFDVFFLNIGNVFFIDHLIVLRIDSDHLQVLSISEKNKADKWQKKYWGLEYDKQV